MQHNKRILVIDDEESIRYTFDCFLSDEGYDVATAADYASAIEKLENNDFDLVFADIVLGGSSGIDLMREARKIGMTCPFIMITGAPNIDTASEAVRLGAFDYIPKPVNQETLIHAASMAVKHKALNDEKEKYRNNLEAIFSSVKDAIITVDRELIIVEVNRAAMEICGISRDFAGRHFGSLSMPCMKRCLDALEETIRGRKPVELYRVECGHMLKQGHIVSLSTSPLLDRNGTFSGAVIIVKDETRLSALERDLNDRRQFHNIIGVCKKMQDVYGLIESLADVQSTVLITGESGTGKELVAEAIHFRGARTSGPMVKVNCSALSENLLESELFGHVKGAFTGAIRDRVGRFQMADGGTIFLDEIGDISPKIQLYLLRVLQEREFERVGDSKPIKVDVRIIAATNQDLEAKVKAGSFREDLYYRLKVVEVKLPPLRERTEDIPLLTEHFIKKFNQKMNRSIVGVSEDTARLFMQYEWPGNIREFEHTIEHSFILCRADTITQEHLPANIRTSAEKNAAARPPAESPEDEIREIIGALEKTAGNKAKAARVLGIDRKTLYRKIWKYKIEDIEE